VPGAPAVFHHEVLLLDVAEFAHAGEEGLLIRTRTRPIVEFADAPQLPLLSERSYWGDEPTRQRAYEGSAIHDPITHSNA
jgi:hypothetical protein